MAERSLSLIIPVFNEEEVLETSYGRMRAAMEQTGYPFEIIYVNDGSRDDSMKILRQLAKEDDRVKVLSFSRNFGHQTAVTCGMDAAIFRVRDPHVSLDYDAETGIFIDTLGNDEIQLLANLMKSEWINRTIAVWDNLRQLYSDKDFSQANFLDKLNKTGAQVENTCRLMLDRYGRAVHYKPNKIFGKLAGKG